MGLTIAQLKEAGRLAPPDAIVIASGPPGYGKSSAWWQLAQELDETYWPLYLATKEAVEMNGLPRVFEKDGRFYGEWAPFAGVFPLACETYPKRIRINLDDIGQATPSVVKAAIRCVYGDGSKRLMGAHELYPDIRICGTTNLHTHRAGAGRFETYAANRVTFLEVEPDWHEVFSCLLGRNAHPSVTGFIGWTKTVTDFAADKDAFMSPRSLENLSKWRNAFASASVNGDLLRAAAVGTIGPEKGTEYLAYDALSSDLPDMDAVLEGKRVKLPTRPEVQYMFVSTLVRAATAEHVPVIAPLITQLTEAGATGFEVAAFLTFECLKGSAVKLRGLNKQPALYKWLSEYGKYLP